MKKFFVALVLLGVLVACWGDRNGEEVLVGDEVQVGDTIQFGDYNWRVLDMQDGNALILSDAILENRHFRAGESMDQGLNPWSVSPLRLYLNDEFYNNFSETDREKILPTLNINHCIFGWEDEDTVDNIFLLSIEEVVRYFGDSGLLSELMEYIYNDEESDEDSPFQLWIADEFSESRIAYDMNGSVGFWWLRSQNHGGIVGSFVCTLGSIRFDSFMFLPFVVDFSEVEFGIRPALWINLGNNNDVRRIEEISDPILETTSEPSSYPTPETPREPLQMTFSEKLQMEIPNKILSLTYEILDSIGSDEYFMWGLVNENLEARHLSISFAANGTIPRFVEEYIDSMKGDIMRGATDSMAIGGDMSEMFEPFRFDAGNAMYALCLEEMLIFMRRNPESEEFAMLRGFMDEDIEAIPHEIGFEVAIERLAQRSADLYGYELSRALANFMRMSHEMSVPLGFNSLVGTTLRTYAFSSWRDEQHPPFPYVILVEINGNLYYAFRESGTGTDFVNDFTQINRLARTAEVAP